MSGFCKKLDRTKNEETGFEDFSDLEVYAIKRALIEASGEIWLSGNYCGDFLQVYQDLMNRVILEDSKRIYGK